MMQSFSTSEHNDKKYYKILQFVEFFSDNDIYDSGLQLNSFKKGYIGLYAMVAYFCPLHATWR